MSELQELLQEKELTFASQKERSQEEREKEISMLGRKCRELEKKYGELKEEYEKKTEGLGHDI